MKRRIGKRGILFVLSALLLLGAAAGCGVKKQTEKTEEKKQSLRIAIQPVVGFLPLYIMKEQKLLEQALSSAGYDVEVTYTEYESGPPENEAFAAGLMDIGVMGNVPALSGIASGQERTILGIAYNGEETEAILVPKDSAIKQVADLKGKKIGLVVGSIAQNLVSAVFEKNGLTFGDVEFVNLSAGEQQQALANGEVDAVATWEPTISKLTADGSNVVLADGTGVFLGENPIVARTKYLEENSDIVTIFLSEYKKAAQLLKEDPESYAQKYHTLFGLDEEIVRAALKHAELPVVITDEDVKDLQSTADFLKREALITKEIKVSGYVDLSYSKNLK